MNGGQVLSNRGQALVSAPLARLVRGALTPGATDAVGGVGPCTLAALTQDLDALVHRDGTEAGLRLGAQASMAAFGVLGYLAMSSPHLGAVIALMQRYERVVLRAAQTTLTQQGAVVQLHWRLRDQALPAALEDLMLMAWCRLGQWLVGQPLVPTRVFLTARPVSHAPDYAQWFGCPVVRDSVVAGLEFPVEWLALDVRHADPQMHRWMEERASTEMRALAADGYWSRQVNAMLPELMRSHSAHLDAAASVLGLSARSLRRRLQEEGTGFLVLLQQQRQALACQYLRQTPWSVLDIALALGYAEHSAFSVAFRQWTGMTPSDWRARQREGLNAV